ncbi:DUF1254 domain-containing protein [Rhodovulum strictum]|uniref:DUF1254 domain-containing protein n=1 Tax=Rhodovulum strictum TaxID=58314 RepID=A0A844B935_9RHOB|nr:DUF1254 domain-containing protein [Rhodovulum strictum]MRH22896.1 DUF1254 domain-containing protein [Rhodovulum strictum]
MSRLLDLMKAALPALLLAFAAPPSAQATEPAQDEDLAYAIGVQTYISHFPLMDLYRTLWETSFDPGRGHDRTLNEFFVFDRLVDSSDDFIVSPNNDTIYLRAFVDLRAEPVILVIPPMGERKYWVPISDMWHDHDANLSFDTVGSQGGAFALVAPGWQGVLPEGVRRVEMSTPLGWLLPRILVADDADLPAAVELQKGFRLVPLSQWGAAEVARPAPDPEDFPRITRDDLTDARAYFTTLNEVLRLSPRLGNPMGAAMASWLHEINMDPATGFDWDALSPATQAGLERAAADAHRIITARTQRSVPIVNNWQVARFDRRISGEPLFAAAASMIGILWNPAEINTYDLAFQDGDGAQLDGRNAYMLRLDPPPPVDGFWSVTMYSAETRIFVPNAIDRYSIGDRTSDLVYGEDGSIEIFMQAEEPTDPLERANWLPAPEGPFYLLMRHYSPQASILTGDWLPPAIMAR